MKEANLIFFLARRNVRRYWRRGLQLFLVLFAGTACVMLIDAFMRGFQTQAAGRVVSLSGHVDAHAPGYVDSMDAFPLDLAIEDSDAAMALMSAEASAAGTIVLSAAAIAAGALLSNGDESVPLTLAGMQAYADSSLSAGKTRVDDTINPALSGVPRSLKRGRYFADPGEAGAIIDEKRAEKLSLGPGDPAILLCTDSTGSFAMFETKILGIAPTDSLPMGSGCVVDLGSVRAALGMEGKATSISLWFARERDGAIEILGPGAEEDAAAAAIGAARSRGLEGRPFREISAGNIAMLNFLDAFIAGMLLVFVLVAGAGMTNTILLSVQDRVRDMGTLRAIALTSRGTGFLVAAETLIVGAVASVIAFIVMSVVIAIMERTGVGFVFEFGEISESLPPKIGPIYEPSRSVFIALTAILLSLLAAAVPIRKAMKLTVRESCMGA